MEETTLKIRGQYFGYVCPICDEILQEKGDIESPAIIVKGEKICDDCKVKLKKLIGR